MAVTRGIRFTAVAFAIVAMPLCSLAMAEETAAPDEEDGPVLELIVVTAQKMGESDRLAVPISTTAIGAEAIERQKLVGMIDYLRFQPGISYIDEGTARNSVVIRGITADPQRGGTTAGIYVDETPLQGLGFAGTGSPDLKLVDIERVEVLRGPQGTLYGAQSLAGTVRTLTRVPNPDAFEASLALSGSSTSGNGEGNSDVTATINLPAGQEFAFRATAYRFENSGYIDNLAGSDPIKLAGVDAFGARIDSRTSDRGSSTYDGFRAGALWRINDRLDVRLSHLEQDIHQDGLPTTDERAGRFGQSRYRRLDGTGEGLSDDLGLTSLTVHYDGGHWTLVSATSLIDYDNEINYDVGLFFIDAFGGVEPPTFIRQAFQSEVLTEELRVTFDRGDRWRLLGGLFYEDAERGFDQHFVFEGNPGLDPFGPSPPDRDDTDARQTALFADATLRLTPAWELNLGMRRFDYDSQNRGVFFGEPSGNDFDEQGETFKLGVHWRPDVAALGEQPLVYGVWSEGFRPGFPVGDAPPICDLDGDGLIDGFDQPLEDIRSDDLDSFELGYKSTFASRRVAIEASAYHIDWDGIPVDAVISFDCPSTIPVNAGAADSDGFEIGLNALLGQDLQLDLSASWNRTELSEDSGVLGEAGDRLPASPELNASIGLEYGFRVRGLDTWIRGDANWVGDYYNDLQESPPKLGDYVVVNLAAGIRFGAWSAEGFVHNLNDADEYTWVSTLWPRVRGSVLRPRTVGVRFSYHFDSL